MKPTFFLSLFLSLMGFLFMPSSVNGALRNQTFDDFDRSIVYEPLDRWEKSDNLTCSDCLQPDPQFAEGQTYHYGYNPTSQPNQASPVSSPVVTPTATSAGRPGDDRGGDDHGGGDDSGGDDGGKGGARKRYLPKLMSRDSNANEPPSSTDIQVSASINFTGTAVYVYCIVPMNVNNASLLSTTNLTFTLDGQPVQFRYQRKPQMISASPTSFNYIMPPVFSLDSLDMEPHSLSISVATGSMVLLDKIVISGLTGDEGNMDQGTGRKKNAATFAVAIGTTLGILALLSLAVFISLYYRRRKSALHSKIREARLASLRPLSPEMRGIGQPFVPQYFPGAPPYRPPSRVVSPGGGSRRSSHEIGPSHGLNYPLAPDAPPYSPPRTTAVLSSTPTITPLTIPLAVALRSPVSRVRDDNDVVPPSYNEAQSTPLVTVFAYSPPSRQQSSNVSPSLTTDSQTVSPTEPSAASPTSISSSVRHSSREGYSGLATTTEHLGEPTPLDNPRLRTQ